MGQWRLNFDLFWGEYVGMLYWLYVKPQYRGSGIPAAIIAELCSQCRESGATSINAEGYEPPLSKLYERVAFGWDIKQCAIAAEAFQVLADLAGLPPREIVKRLPKQELNYVLPNKR